MIRTITTAFCLAALFTVTVPVSAAKAAHGFQEFTTSSVWICPKGIKTIQVEMWGAGGGGGGGFQGTFTGGGGAGGSGGYLRGFISVKQGASYTVTVGTGGAAGNNTSSTAGLAGTGCSLVEALGTELAAVEGGQGGGAASDGLGGIGGNGGESITTNFLSRTGHKGGNGTYSPVIPTQGATPGPVRGSIDIPDPANPSRSLGAGGNGGINYLGEPQPGSNGTVILIW